MKKFPSIEQFRNVVRSVREHHDYKGKDENGSPIYVHTEPYPKIIFNGTVKLHGTNAAVVKYPDRVEYQSRERVLSILHDNSGFMMAMSNKNLDDMFGRMATEFKDYLAVYGEWCGQGIQKGVAVSELPKMFVVFAVRVDDVWVTPNFFVDESQGMYNVNQFQTYSIEIDFNQPELSQNTLADITAKVEYECPIGKHFGVYGIGEGVVWTANYDGEYFQFKVKGEKHSASKVKTLASVDVEAVANLNEFASLVLTDSRLQQGIAFLTENGHRVDQTSTGTYLKWVVGDVFKEESDTIVKNQIDAKKVGGFLSNKAREWYFNYINQNFQ
jgi:hypothetical protein